MACAINLKRHRNFLALDLVDYALSLTLIRGTLIQRYQRFLADVRLTNGEIVTAHCANTGSMMGREVVTRQGTRLDLCLEGSKGACFVEVKNVTLAVGGTAAFPDAVTERGTKHLKELMWLRRKGHRAAVVFVIQRNDCTIFRPADEIDGEYGRWLRRAVTAGVAALPYMASVTPKEFVLKERLPIRL